MDIRCSKFNKPLVLLVNGGTASASEILSGAVRDFKAGKLIGTKTFGKGNAVPFVLSDGSALKVTIARYYTPSGEYPARRDYANISVWFINSAKKLFQRVKY